jgi:hypothetical protein
MLLGSTEIEAVGAGGGGGGGGGAGAAFFLQPPSITIAPNAKTIVHRFSFCFFTFLLRKSKLRFSFSDAGYFLAMTKPSLADDVTKSSLACSVPAMPIVHFRFHWGLSQAIFDPDLASWRSGGRERASTSPQMVGQSFVALVSLLTDEPVHISSAGSESRDETRHR